MAEVTRSKSPELHFCRELPDPSEGVGRHGGHPQGTLGAFQVTGEVNVIRLCPPPESALVGEGG